MVLSGPGFVLGEGDLERPGLAGVVFEKEPFEQVETVGPEPLVETQPLLGAGERPGVQATQVSAPAHLAADQSGVLEHLDVLGGRGERHGEGLRQLAHRPFAADELAEHPPAGRVAEGVKDRGELGRL